jgi:hypothetical protein
MARVVTPSMGAGNRLLGVEGRARFFNGEIRNDWNDPVCGIFLAFLISTLRTDRDRVPAS